jgi:PAS domain S-box-containing protein
MCAEPLDPSVETHLVTAAATSVDRVYAGRTQAEQKSKDSASSEERIRLVFEAASCAMLMVNQHGNIVLVNSQAGKYFGYSHDELLGKSVEMLVPTRFRERHPEYLAGFFATPRARQLGAGRDLFGMRKDGSEFAIEIGLNPIETLDGLMVLSSIVDITERKCIEERLRESATALAFANALAISNASAFSTALASSNESLRIANEELLRKNLELDEFTFAASHDLQEPLHKITAFGELLSKDLGGALPEAAGKDLGFITDAAKRMRTLVQDLLALSRAGREALKRERVSLAECADRALYALDVQIQKSGAEITRDALPDVLGDHTILTQLYQNLIGNALKFAEPGRKPEIHLTCERKENQWILGVRDNGIGIKPEYHEQIFAPFKRLHGCDEYEGTGIGLAICRKAVERHGGRIWVESEPGRGTHFKFTLNCETESLTWLSETPSTPSSSSPRMIPATRS